MHNTHSECWPSIGYCYGDKQKEVYGDLRGGRVSYYIYHDKSRNDRLHDNKRECPDEELERRYLGRMFTVQHTPMASVLC